MSPPENAIEGRTGSSTKCSVCAKLAYRGRDVLASAFADNPLWDFDAGLYELMHRVDPETSNEPEIEPAKAAKIAAKVQKHTKRLQTELTKVGLFQRENQTFSGNKGNVRWMAPLSMEEIELGRLLGTGGFSSAFEVKGFNLDPQKIVNCYEERARSFLESHAQEVIDDPTTGKYRTARYAIKHLRKALTSEPDKFERAAIDLALEAQLLLVMDHPHIISIRGWTDMGPESYTKGRHNDYFIVLDRLPHTLEDTIGGWRQSLRKYQSRLKFPWPKKKYQSKIENLLFQRIRYLHDAASAVEYMHDRRIINRDLKAGNIGFDVSGELKLFDFGLSRVLPCRCDVDEFYAMSRVGTKYYIAPEIKKKQPYNLSADVYSFAVVIWETMALATPREVLHKMHLSRDQERNPAMSLPICECCWSPELVALIRRSLSAEPTERPCMSSVRLALKGLMDRIGTKGMKVQKKRRSTFRVDISNLDLSTSLEEATSNASSLSVHDTTGTSSRAVNSL